MLMPYGDNFGRLTTPNSDVGPGGREGAGGVIVDRLGVYMGQQNMDRF